jgi:hypothetical protein
VSSPRSTALQISQPTISILRALSFNQSLQFSSLMDWMLENLKATKAHERYTANKISSSPIAKFSLLTTLVCRATPKIRTQQGLKLMNWLWQTSS